MFNARAEKRAWQSPRQRRIDDLVNKRPGRVMH
jgi:hypothetical protein